MSFMQNLRCGAATVALALVAGGAQAQSSDTQMLQQQIQQLQQQLQALQNQVNAQMRAQQQQAAPAVAAAAAPAPAPHVTQSAGNRFGFESADGQYSIALTGRLHFDAGTFLDYHAAPGSAPKGLASGVNARRARLGVVGKFAGDWDYSFIYDAGGSADGAAGIENAYVTYNGFKKMSVPLAIDFGYQDTPYSLDEATSSNNIMFMERASSQVIATNFGAGDNRSAFGVRSNDDRYWAGVYLTGPAAGSAHTAGVEPYGAFGRFTYQVLQADDYSLHLGVDALGTLRGAGHPETIALSDKPEIRLDSTSLIGSTIGTGTNPVTGGSVIGTEAAGGFGPWFAQGEYFHYTVSRRGLSDNNFDGGYVEGSWTVTGEHRKYDPGSGAYGGINPAHPFSLSAGTWGAFEIGLRFSEINLNDAIGHANAVVFGRQDVYTVGLNWYPNSNIRMMFDYLHGDIKRNESAAPGTAAGNFDAIATRMQVAF